VFEVAVLADADADAGCGCWVIFVDEGRTSAPSIGLSGAGAARASTGLSGRATSSC